MQQNNRTSRPTAHFVTLLAFSLNDKEQKLLLGLLTILCDETPQLFVYHAY
jgi:hypothetical protein